MFGMLRAQTMTYAGIEHIDYFPRKEGTVD